MSNPYEGDANTPNVDGIAGTNTSDGNGVAGFSQDGIGVRGDSANGIAAVHGHGFKNGVWGYTVSANDSGVFGSNDGNGMAGFSQDGIGVRGDSANGIAAVHGNGAQNGVWGYSQDGIGVRGDSANGFAAVHGHGFQNGVFGYTVSANDSGVLGSNGGSGNGVAGFSQDGIGVRGDSANGFAAVHGNGAQNGVWGYSQDGIGVRGDSANGFAAVHGHGFQHGVFGYTVSANDSGVLGSNGGSGNGVAGVSVSGNGVYGSSQTGNAGFFQGNVTVTGDIFLPGADCAEDFDIASLEQVEPATVMSITNEGTMEPSRQAYDNRVAGVLSGAGIFKPGIILDRKASGKSRLPVALIGKVNCKVDADFAPIQVG